MGSQAVLNSFLLAKDQLISLAIAVEDAHLERLAHQGVEPCQDLILVSTTHPWVVLGRQLRHWQKAPHTFVLNQHTTTVSVVWRHLDDLTGI